MSEQAQPKVVVTERALVVASDRPADSRRTPDARIAQLEMACGEGWAPFSVTPLEMLNLLADLKDAEARVTELEQKVAAAESAVTPLPPWTVYAQDGAPIAIIPSGRPGTVLNVRGWNMGDVTDLVQAANKIVGMRAFIRRNHR